MGEGEVTEGDFPGYWYWVSLPYEIVPTIFGDDISPDTDIDSVVLWCAQQLGVPQAPGHRIQRQWRKDGCSTFHFRKKKDRDWFILKWT